MTLPAWLGSIDWSGTLTIAGAALGAVLGVVNTWWALGRDRVRLRIVPVWHSGDQQMQNGQVSRTTSAYAGALQTYPDGRLGVRIINRGFMAVIIEDVGFTASGYFNRHLRKAQLIRRSSRGDADDLVRLPVKLEPRASITIWCLQTGTNLDAKVHDARRVYVNTACGLDIFATSRLFRRLAKRATARRKNL